MGAGLRILRPCAAFIDMAANEGYFSGLVGSHGTVIVVEPRFQGLCSL